MVVFHICESLIELLPLMFLNDIFPYIFSLKSTLFSNFVHDYDLLIRYMLRKLHSLFSDLS